MMDQTPEPQISVTTLAARPPLAPDNNLPLPGTAAWADLVSTLAHAIRNPLTGISINVQYLQMVYGQSQAQREIYSDIMEALSSLDQMIREFVEFTGTLHLKSDPVDLNLAASRALAGHDALIHSRKITVAKDLEAALPDVQADAHYFSRALSGLIEHCAYTMDEGGQIRVSSRLKRDVAVLEIFRSGPPLSPQRLDSLFDPLTALQSPESGFGMAFVHKILSAHGCRLEIDTRSSNDTRFTVLFPLR